MTGAVDKGTESWMLDQPHGRERLSLPLPRAVYTHQFQNRVTSQLSGSKNPQAVISAAIENRARDIHEQHKCVTEENRRAHLRLRRSHASFIAGRNRHHTHLHDAILHSSPTGEDDDGSDSDDSTADPDKQDNTYQHPSVFIAPPSPVAPASAYRPHHISAAADVDTGRSPMRSASSYLGYTSAAAATITASSNDIEPAPAASGGSRTQLPSVSFGRNTPISGSPSNPGSLASWYGDGQPRGSPIARRSHSSCCGLAPATASGCVEALPPMPPARSRTQTQSMSGNCLIGTLGGDRDRDRESSQVSGAMPHLGPASRSGSSFLSPSRSSSEEAREPRDAVGGPHRSHPSSHSLLQLLQQQHRAAISNCSSSNLNNRDGSSNLHHQQSSSSSCCYPYSGSNRAASGTGYLSSGCSSTNLGIPGLAPRSRSSSTQGFVISAARRALEEGAEAPVLPHQERLAKTLHPMRPLPGGLSPRQAGTPAGGACVGGSSGGAGALSRLFPGRASSLGAITTTGT